MRSPLAVAVLLPAVLSASLAGCGSSSDPRGAAGAAGSTPTTTTPASTVKDIHVSMDGGGDIGTTDTDAADLRTRLGTFNTGLNEGILVDSSGNLYATGLIAGVGTLRIVPNIATRTGSFDSSQDTSLSFSSFKAPKGFTLAGLTSNQLIVADAQAPGTSSPSTVPALHLLTTLVGTVQPQELAVLYQDAIGGPVWDVAYDSATDRLYASLTTGSIAVIDTFTTLATVNAASSVHTTRFITPGQVVNGVSAKVSTNLHGIAYNSGTDQLVVSDVGSATDAADGAVYVIDSASSASDVATGGGTAITVPSKTVKGPATLLGNPVDVLLRADGRLFVAEKANGGGQILVFPSILTTSTGAGNAAPTLAVTTASLGSTGTPESLALVLGQQ